MIDNWFLEKLQNLLAYEREIEGHPLSEEAYIRGKQLGYTDAALARLCGTAPVFSLQADLQDGGYLRGGICRRRRPISTRTFEMPRRSGGVNEATELVGAGQRRARVVVLGSGPIRIGQGIEFDYCERPLRLVAAAHWATRSSSSTTTRRRFPRTSTPPTGCILSRFAPEDVLHIIDIGAAWRAWSCAFRRPDRHQADQAC